MLKLPVAPAVRPTVAKADTDSKRLSVNPMGDVALINSAPNILKPIKIVTIVTASNTLSVGILRLKTHTVCLPLARVHMNSSKTTNVTVFTPPAVEPEDPPISIKNILTPFPASVSSAWSTDAKPAVRTVTDWKKPLRIFSPGAIAPSVPGLFHSSRQNTNAPHRIKHRLVVSTSLVYMLNFLQL